MHLYNTKPIANTVTEDLCSHSSTFSRIYSPFQEPKLTRTRPSVSNVLPTSIKFLLTTPFPTDSKGNAAALGMSILMLLSAIGLRFYLSYLNKKKRANQFTEEAALLREKSIEELGDHHPDFFYTL